MIKDLLFCEFIVHSHDFKLSFHLIEFKKKKKIIELAPFTLCFRLLNRKTGYFQSVYPVTLQKRYATI